MGFIVTFALDSQLNWIVMSLEPCSRPLLLSKVWGPPPSVSPPSSPSIVRRGDDEVPLAIACLCLFLSCLLSTDFIKCRRPCNLILIIVIKKRPSLNSEYEIILLSVFDMNVEIIVLCSMFLQGSHESFCQFLIKFWAEIEIAFPLLFPTIVWLVSEALWGSKVYRCRQKEEVRVKG